MAKSLVFLGVVSVSGLLSAASPTENSRWVSQYFEQVYAADSPYFVEGSGWIDSFEQSRKKWAAAADSERTMRAADVLWADFQALDHNGHVVQTMRSWATLQPGETFGCVGCHETKCD